MIDSRGLSGIGTAELGQKYSTIATSHDPDGQVAQTMPLIQQYSSEDSTNPLIQNVALSYANRMPGATPAQIAYAATKDHLIFASDQAIAKRATPQVDDFVVEVLRRPIDTVLFNRIEGRRPDGDCDDFSMFAASIGAALGADVRFVTVAADPREPSVLSHIYTIIDGVPVDASHGPFAGWEVPSEHVSRRVEYPIRPSAPLWILAVSVAWYVFGPWIRGKVAEVWA